MGKNGSGEKGLSELKYFRIRSCMQILHGARALVAAITWLWTTGSGSPTVTWMTWLWMAKIVLGLYGFEELGPPIHLTLRKTSVLSTLIERSYQWASSTWRLRISQTNAHMKSPLLPLITTGSSSAISMIDIAYSCPITILQDKHNMLYKFGIIGEARIALASAADIKQIYDLTNATLIWIYFLINMWHFYRSCSNIFFGVNSNIFINMTYRTDAVKHYAVIKTEKQGYVILLPSWPHQTS